MTGRLRRMLCASVLLAEALVIFFALLVVVSLTALPSGPVVLAGLGAVAACLVLAGLLRYRWAYVAGSLLQVLLLLTGLVLPVLTVVAAVFAGLWVLALVLARRAEQLAARRAG